MCSKRHLMCRKTFIIVLASIFVLTFVGIYINARDVRAAAPTVKRIPNPNPQENALFGMAVTGISDIDNDGIGDLIVGVPGIDQVYVLSGADQTHIGTIDSPDDSVGYSFGYAVSVVGDRNNDGFDEIAVGAPGASGSPKTSCDSGSCPDPKSGRVYVFSGAGGYLMLTIVPEDLDFWAFGSALATIGDVNCDGTPDIAVGAPENESFSMGKVYLFSGEDGTQIWATSEPEPCAGEKQAKASFGAHLAGISDITGDGINDLLVGAPMFDCDPDPDVHLTAGRAFVLSGANGTIFREHENPVPTLNDNFGTGVCAIGDQDGDGKEDYCVGEPGIGTLYLFSGETGNLIRKIESPGDSSNDFFGYSVARVDDMDSDDFDDLWVGAPKGGAVYLINGMGDLLIELIDVIPVPSGTEGGFGWQLAATEDLNNDSGMDLIIGKPAESLGWQFNKAGAVYLVLGAYVNTPPVADAGPERTISADGDCLAKIYLDGSGSYDPDGDTLTYEWTWSYGSVNKSATGVKPFVTLPLGVTEITLTVSDGMDTDTDTVIITVKDTTPPVIVCPSNITAEQTSADGTPVNLGSPAVTDNCDNNPLVTNDAPAVFPLGTTIVTWIAKDFSGNTSSCTQTVTIVDTTPPVIKSLTASPNNLWPPNHKMVPVTVTCVCKDICDIAPVCMIISVVSSQPVNDTGDGNTEPDWVITGDLSVDLRAEKSGNDKAGRIYTITVECTDFSGNSSSATVNVIVPHDQGNKSSSSKSNKTQYNNPVTYYGTSAYNTAYQNIGIIPVAQPQGIGIGTSSNIQVNVSNVNTNFSVRNNRAPITVLVNSNQVNNNVTNNNQAKSNALFSPNNFLPLIPSAQARGNLSPFGFFGQQTFFNGNNNRGFGGNNNWAFGGNNNRGFGGNNNWSHSNFTGNHLGWSQNLYKPNTNSFFTFSSNPSFSVFNNSSFNSFQFR